MVKVFVGVVLTGMVLGFFESEAAVAGEAKTIEVSFDKIVLIVFGKEIPQNYITNVSVGLVESVGFSYNKNTIVLQALKEGELFTPTNLLVKLKSGRLFMYDVVYNNAPQKLLIQEKIEGDSTIPNKNLLLEKEEEGGVNREVLLDKEKKLRMLVKEKRDYFQGIGMIKDRMKVWCGGLWKEPKGNEYYMKVGMYNFSNVDFVVGGVSVDIIEKGHKMKRSVRVKKSVLKDDGIKEERVVKGKSSAVFVIKMKAITIAKDKNVKVDIWEVSPGERRFLLTLSSMDLLNIRFIY